MSRKSTYSINSLTGASASALSSISALEPFLIVEKSLEVNGQQWLENVNVIEEFLVQTVQKLSRDYPQLSGSFVVRRLPNFMVPYTNRNEYAVILDKFDFSLVPHDPSSKPSSDKAGKPNFGQLEIFLPRKKPDSGDRGCQPVHTPTPAPSEADSDKDDISKDNPNSGQAAAKVSDTETETMGDCHVFLSAAKAYYSHEVFKAFATAFVKVTQGFHDSNSTKDSEDSEESLNMTTSTTINECGVQLIGPHLLKDLHCNLEMSKIFRLVPHPPIRLSSSLREKCSVTVNHLKSFISVTYEDTEIILRPCLFYQHGYHRVNANVTERIPLYHGGILTIGESLLRGCLLFPTSFETLWTLQFWPAESHILSLYHPSSVILRLYKIFGAFCLNPGHFYETLQNNFLIGSLEDMSPYLDKAKLLPLDYFSSGFLYELEEFPGIDDWAPRNFSTRLMHLLRSALDSFDKGFHSHYFTKINVLRGLWRNSADYDIATMKDLSSIRESPDDPEDYRDHFLETNDLEDEFGLRFDDLPIHDDDFHPPKPLTSDLVYNSSINPFQEETKRSSSNSKGHGSTSKSLSRILGSSFLKKISGSGSRTTSEAGTVRITSPQNTVRSMADVASEFEKSIALQRSRPSLFPFPIQQNEEIQIPGSGVSSNLNLFTREKPGTSQQQYDNDAFDDGQNSVSSDTIPGGGDVGIHPESIYYFLLQCLKDLPPSDAAIEPDVQEYIDKTKRAMQSQEELILSWGKVIADLPKPKFICPHAFTSRQVQYLARVIHVVSRCSPSTIKIIRSSQLPSWEISGDILRIVLHQMRSESSEVNCQEMRAKPKPRKKSTSFLIPRRFSNNDSDSPPRRPIFKSFKRDSTSSNDLCKLHDHAQTSKNTVTGDLDPEEEMQLALEDPETAATNRLLQWLWQLRTSEIGRLSTKAAKYLESLYQVSLINSHFLEQHSEDKVFETLALRSAVAVTKIIETGKFPAHVPLSTAAKKGWLWAEMVLSLASWNFDKGLHMKALVPLPHQESDDDGNQNYLIKAISPPADSHNTPGSIAILATTTTKKRSLLEPEPDLDAVTLAFHSELATPIGWNDIEDPRQPGPLTIPILIFSSLNYYKLWELVPGNLVHALVRLQKFNTLQHVANMLTHPHRKTALNEVRKLNKSTSFRIHHFENNIMSKTFKRLASLRSSRRKPFAAATSPPTPKPPTCLTCEEAGCGSSEQRYQNREIECTKL